MNYFQKKKLFLMSVVNKVKGFVRSVSGIPPITLENCVDDNSVINYQIYGNTVQDGEASVENPIYAQSVGDNSIFDWDVFSTSIDSQGYPYFDISNLPVNTVMTVSTKDEFLYKICATAGGSPIYQSNNATNKAITLTSNMITAGRLYFITASYTVAKLADLENQNIKITIDKYKISVTASGKNLFDAKTMFSNYVNNPCSKIEYLTNGYFKIYRHSTTLYSCGAIFAISLKAGTYTVSVKTIEKNYTRSTWTFYSSTLKRAIYEDGATTFTLTEATKIAFQCNLNEETNAIGNYAIIALQIEAGDTATEYEPYIEPVTTTMYTKEPIRAIGEYRDCIDSANKKLVRNVAESQFLSKYMQSKSASSNDIQFISLVLASSPFGKSKMGKEVLVIGFNSIGVTKPFRDDYTNYADKVYWGNNVNTTTFFSIPVSLLTAGGYTNDIAGAKAWVDAQNAISPIMITYILEEPTEEDIELPDLPTFKGKNVTYTFDTTVQPSNMVVDYYSTTKGE